MAVSCFNINAPEYVALKGEYRDRLTVDSLVNKWQSLNKTDAFPTVTEARNFVKIQKAAFNLKKRKFGDAVLNNLSEKGLISKYRGQYWVNNSNRVTREYDAPTLARNLDTIKRYLSFKNIPLESVSIQSTPKSFIISIDSNLFTNSDVLQESRDNDGAHVTDIIQHLGKMFPQLEMNVVSVADARIHYDSLPQNQKAISKQGNVLPFDKVTSYYVDGQVMLIKGRVTVETSIEEILHPFIDAVYVDNKSLFNGLLAEAKNTFPELAMQIEDSYSELRGFTAMDRELELVTQALSRHFKNEHETRPTSKWKTLVSDLLKWLSTVIKDLHLYITGKDLSVKAINPNATMTDVAKLLNTEDLTFKLESRANIKIRYKLTDELQSIVDHAKATAVNDLQRSMLDHMFHKSIITKEDVESLTATGAAEEPTVVLNEENHEYYALETGEEYYSSTKSIKGEMPAESVEMHKLNLQLGNDFDKIAEGIAGGLTFDAILPNLEIIGESVREVIIDGKVMNANLSREAYATMTGYVAGMRMNGAVVVPQVVIADHTPFTKDGIRYGGIAGKADLLIIQPDGRMGIIDLKTSKNSIFNTQRYDKKWPLEKGSILLDKGETELSTRQQHSIQVALYRRLFENMGYTMMDDHEMGVSTFNILVTVSGQGKDQQFGNSFEVQDWVNHPPSQNQTYVNKIVESNINQASKAKIDALRRENGMDNPARDNEPAIDQPENITYSGAMYDTIFKALTDLKIGLLTRQEALEKTRNAITMDKTREESLDHIVNTISGINVALMTGAKATAKEYTKILQDTIREMEDFIEYVKNPANFNDPEFIMYVLNFDKFIDTYRGLTSLQDSSALNKTQNQLIVTLLGKLIQIEGTKKDQGLITQAIKDYTATVVKENSNREDLTKEELDSMMKMADDIGLTEYATYDLSTSGDTILAIMDKLWKRKRQEVLDKIDTRNRAIRTSANALEKLSPGGKADYSFMLQYDPDGKFTGRYIQKIGYGYWRMRWENRQDLFDEEGKWKEYIYIENLGTAQLEDINFNKELFKARKKNREFLQAEERTDEGGYRDGEYHMYTKEFKDERAKYEVWENRGTHGAWERKKGISDVAYQRYLAKNYETKQVHFAKYNNKKEFTGQTYMSDMSVVKNTNKEIRESSRSGQEMRDAKWLSIMNPTNSLEVAQKEFYLMFREQFEEKLLTKLPMGVRDQMLGKAPLVMDTLYESVKNKPNMVASAWARSKRWVKNGFTRTSHMKRVMVDENGDFIDTLPIFYVGNPRSEEALGKIFDKIGALKDEYDKGKIKIEAYELKKAELEGMAQRLRTQPTKEEISQDMADSLLRFSAMAENYEVMGTIEDTLVAMIKTLEQRTYASAGDTTMVATIKGKKQKVGIAGKDSLTYKRAKKWMKMVYYDNDKQTRGAWDKAVSHLIDYSSLSYVAFNVFGNINNYTIARINNMIETAGGRFYSASAMRRATYEFNARALPDLVNSTAFMGKSGSYKEYVPESKWEALVDHFRMMDKKADIRESGQGKEKEGWVRRKLNWGYLLNDSFEYNVQTKVGMAMLMTRMIKNSKTGETLSLFDAYQKNGDGTVTIQEGFDTMVDKNGDATGKTWNEQNARYDLRNEIREVNKQIHGNYAYEDRMVMQSYSLGQLAAQFHKWVVPAIKARYRREYFDENVGWLEGRYLSMIGFMKYAATHIGEVNQWATNYKTQYSETDEQGRLVGEFSNRAQMKMLNVYRTLGEIGIMMTTLASAVLLESLFDDDDDPKERKSVYQKRMENALIYQADRAFKEMIQFVPIPGTGGVKQIYQMMKSPIASTRTLGELGEAISSTVLTGTGWIYYSNEEFWGDSDYVYQRKPKTGNLKVAKQWRDAVPILYGYQRWTNFDNQKRFHIK